MAITNSPRRVIAWYSGKSWATNFITVSLRPKATMHSVMISAPCRLSPGRWASGRTEAGRTRRVGDKRGVRMAGVTRERVLPR